ncbi:Ger(x)C family spore germination protein [Bacillus sp. REN3]|uniref:Ger(x)C family spore germination protein n=1 Tax=Bacillus sp. REN3 TaxID=2802440 RepID=UPI001AEF3346|nr:Ger(x)C family spore germination protein [Bacillus sp. REN3]
MKRRFVIVSVIPILFLAACTEPKTMEKIGMITTLGYDLVEDDHIQSTQLLLQIDPEAPESTALLSSKAASSKGARLKSDLESPKRLQSGQLRVALYSEEIAREGLINLADTLARDPSISDLTYLAVVEGNVYELMKHRNDQFSDIGQYIYKELDQNIKGELIPSSTLQETMHDYYAIGVDPVLPTMKLVDGNVKITGLALMKRDKMVAKIHPYQAFYLKLINDRYEAGNLELTISKEGLDVNEDNGRTDKVTVVLDTITSKSRITLIDKKTPEFDLTIHLDSRLLEINQTFDLKVPENIKKLEKAISKRMKKEVESLIAYTQSKNTDPFAFGENYRKSVRKSKLTPSKWHRMYKDSKVNVKIDFRIMRTGVVE